MKLENAVKVCQVNPIYSISKCSMDNGDEKIQMIFNRVDCLKFQVSQLKQIIIALFTRYNLYASVPIPHWNFNKAMISSKI